MLMFPILRLCENDINEVQVDEIRTFVDSKKNVHTFLGIRTKLVGYSSWLFTHKFRQMDIRKRKQ